MSHKGQTAFLTGGAGGIGRAVTGMLISKGIKVFVVDANGPGVQAVADELNNTSESDSQMVWAAECDVCDWDSQRSAFEAAIEALGGRIDFVLPIAGIAERRSFPNQPQCKGFEKPDLKVIEVNEIAAIYTISLAVQHFRRLDVDKHGFRGKILAVASVCGFYIHPSNPVYTASKHAMVGFIRSYGRILAEEHITLNAVCPNKIRTGITSAAAFDESEKRGLVCPMSDVLEAFEKLLPGGEYADIGAECLEVAPKIGVRRVQEWMPFVNEESRLNAEESYRRNHVLHDVVQG